MKPIAARSVRILLFLLLIVFGKAEKLTASHATGAELTYECLGGNQYRLYYALYRDCVGISAPASVNINYTSSCFPGGTVNLSPTPFSPTQIAPICPSYSTTCEGGTYTGIEEWIYTGVLTLPGGCADWIFSYAECCRNSSITTVANVSSYNLYVFSLLNNSDGNCNNSSIFRNRPVQFVCVGQQFCFSNGAFDIDGDSLRYQLITPLTATGTPISYYFPYSYSQPVISSPSAVFNPISGDLCIVPTQSDVSTFAVLVSEYRNGVLVGQVERDVQIEVRACNNFIPGMSGLNGTSSYSSVLCAGFSYEFDLFSSDFDAGQTTSISWDSGISGALLTNSGGLRDTAHFTWTPSISDISTTPYCFTATVRDDNCPYLGTRIYTYCLSVVDASSAACLTSEMKESLFPNSVSVFKLGSSNQYRLEWESRLAYSLVRIFDSAGRQVREILVTGKQQTNLDMENLQSGIYHICLDGEEHWCSRLLRE